MAAGGHICRRTRTIFGACTTRSLGKHIGQVSKESDQWSRMRCVNEIVTLLRKRQIAILKMAAVRPHLLRTRIIFRRTHLGIERNSCIRFRQNSSSGFGGDVITVKIKVGRRRPYLSTDQNHIRASIDRPLGQQLGQVLKKSDQWSRRRYNNDKKFTDGRTNGWTPDGLSMG